MRVAENCRNVEKKVKKGIYKIWEKIIISNFYFMHNKKIKSLPFIENVDEGRMIK